MGNDASKVIRETELAPQTRFPRVINQRFVLDRVVSLRLRNGFWTHNDAEPFEIIDVDAQQTMFKVPSRQVNSTEAPRGRMRKQLLQDRLGVPVVALDAYALDSYYSTFVPSVPLPSSVPAPATWQEHRALCYIETSTRPLEKPLIVSLPDPHAFGGVLKMKVEGVWRDHNALIWAERGRKFERECIARVHVLPDDKRKMKIEKKRDQGSVVPTPYYLDVAAGVDVALLVLICAAMDQEIAKARSAKIEELPADDISTMLAKRHFALSADTRRSTNARSMFVGTDL